MQPEPLLPITVVIVTKNEEANISRCLNSCAAFDQILVVDSNSTDKTPAIVENTTATLINFTWNGKYPKKRGWILETLTDTIKHDWVFFLDADEITTELFIQELRTLSLASATAGYFLYGRYIWQGKPLRHGMMNNKLALINRHKMQFPTINDLNIPGMGEIEGHYQPILKPEYASHPIAQIKSPILHDACDDRESWIARHKRYAQWERGMDAATAWPEEVSGMRKTLKQTFRRSPPWLRATIIMAYSLIYKRGLLDGARGISFARLKASYYLY